jgi:hypothetical protein
MCSLWCAANSEDPVRSLLRAEGARFDAGTRQDESGCLKDTRVDLLNQIDSWIMDDGEDAPWMFVLQGLAGTGKSTIAHTVCRQARERGLLGASFFFSRDEADCSNPFLVFTTIAYQLATATNQDHTATNQYPQFRNALNNILKNDPDVVGLTLEQQLDKLLVDPIHAAADDMSTAPLIVIDAVDECTHYRSQILSLLCIMRAKLPISLKLFISFRPEHDLQTLISSHNTPSGTQSFILHDVDASVVRGDIERFLRFRLSKVATNSEIDPNVWPSAEEISALAKESNKLFIFAVTIVKFIEDTDDDPQSTLKSVMRTLSVMKAKHTDGPSPYERLDRLYQQVIEHAFTKTSAEDAFERFRTVVGAVTSLCDTLPARVLGHLLNIEAREIRRVLLRFHSLVIVPDDDNDIRLIHPSFRDFMTQRCPVTCRYYINPSDCHRKLAVMCFKTMQEGLKRDICDILDMSLLNDEVKDLGARITACIPTHLQYACRHWATHLSQSRTGTGSVDNDISLAVMQFASLHLLHWLEVLSLIGCLAEALPALRHTQHWAFVRPIPTD